MSPQPPTSQEEQLPRDLAGVYRLTHSIGHGGMGVVYGGEHLALQRKVAVKMMRMALPKMQTFVTKPSNVFARSPGLGLETPPTWCTCTISSAHGSRRILPGHGLH